MFLQDTSLQCILQMEVFTFFGSLRQLQTLVQILHMQMLFSYSIGHRNLLSILIPILMSGGFSKRGMCGVRIGVSFRIGRSPTIT
jgi:hypothetical protein